MQTGIEVVVYPDNSAESYCSYKDDNGSESKYSYRDDNISES